MGSVAGATAGIVRAAGQRHQGDAAVRAVADLGGVAADPQALARWRTAPGHRHRGCARVPRQRQPVDRVEGGDALARYGARARLVTLVGVVLPAHVPADVDRAAGHRHRRTSCRRRCSRSRWGRCRCWPGPQRDVVSHMVPLPAPPANAPVAAHHEVRAVRGEVDVADEGVEHAGAGVVSPVVTVGGPGATVAVARWCPGPRAASGRGHRPWRSCRWRRAGTRPGSRRTA